MISNNSAKKQEFQIEEETTFYSSVISHSYYAIFYGAKAILFVKNIKPEMPDVHKNTYEAFDEHFVRTGILDMELLKIYQKMIVRADELLQIFKMKNGNEEILPTRLFLKQIKNQRSNLFIMQ